ncbi:hypothetical protein KI688_004418 [Linnemannia hyalina]|uniref:Uncharacterized protein n=1 Tax=Linnemannia hyalina TaxID=64524 RepID=A0A9P8BP66_9FUNG|nr:hypothetical protein KI688_004418 [Linnemannia hyalina]
MAEKKELTLQGVLMSIAEIESELPPLQGKDASVIEYLKVPGQYQYQLDEFYNGDDMRFKRHRWDAERARDEEFKVVANHLLHLVGGPLYLQSADDEDHYPWMEDGESKQQDRYRQQQLTLQGLQDQDGEAGNGSHDRSRSSPKS